jgi:hypothetical protein
VKPNGRRLLLALGLGAAGCSVAPDAAERQARLDADPYVILPPETGSHMSRRVRASELGSRASMANASPVGSIGGATMRDTKTSLGDALSGP